MSILEQVASAEDARAQFQAAHLGTQQYEQLAFSASYGRDELPSISASMSLMEATYGLGQGTAMTQADEIVKGITDTTQPDKPQITR